MAVQVLDSLIDGPLQLGNEREGNELIGMLVRYLRTGAEPDPRTDAQRMALAMVRPVLERSRARIAAGSKGGSEPKSKQESKPPSKTASKQESKTASNGESKRRSDAYSPSPISDSEDGAQAEESDGIPYAEIVALLNDAAGTSYRPTSRKTQQLIRARWSDGFRLGDFESVIATMAAAWKQDPKMSAYLRPETLFGTKFESYLNRPSARKEAGHDPFAAY